MKRTISPSCRRAARIALGTLVAAWAAPAAVPHSARADSDLAVANRSSFAGSIVPAGETETFRVDVPRGTKVTVSLRGKRRGAEPAATFSVVFLDPDGREVAGSGGVVSSFRRTIETNATGEHRVVVTGATVGAYDLALGWKGVKRLFGGGSLEFGIGAPRERGATGTFSAIAAAPGAQPQVLRERIDAFETQAFPQPAPGAPRHVVTLAPATATADVTFDVADLAGSGVLIDTVFAPKPPKSKKRRYDLSQGNTGTGAGASSVTGAVVGAEGGLVALPETGEIEGASVEIPEGALAFPTAIFVGTAPPFGTPNGATAAGQAFSFGPGNVVFASPVTITISFDPAALVGGTETLQIFTLDEDGSVSLVPPPYTIDRIAGTVSFPASHFSSYRAFVRRPRTFDVSGDGIDDLVLTAPGAKGRRGSIFVFHGGPQRVPSPVPIFMGGNGDPADATLTGPDPDARLGRAVEVGDLDGDGIAEIVTSREAGSAGGEAAVLVYRGGRSLRRSFQRDEPALRFAAPGADPVVGDAFAIGDLNGDSLADLVVGSKGGGPSGQGRVFLVRMRPFDALTGPLGSDGILVGSSAGDEFGFELAMGDMNGDGYPDLFVGAPQRQNSGLAGYVRRYPGSPSFFQNPGLIDPTIFSGTKVDAAFGHTIVLGDADGDGREELFIGAAGSGPFAVPATETGAYLFQGLVSLTNRTDVTAEASLLGGGLDRFAASLAVARTSVGPPATVSLVVGAPDGPNGVTPPRNGRVSIHAVDGTGGVPFFAGVTNFDGAQPQHFFGASVRVLDWNGDGADDVAVGIPGTASGAVHVFFGPGFAADRTVIVGPVADDPTEFGLP